MKINASWRWWLCALVAFDGVLLAQTKETPESVEPPLQITSDGANRYEGGIYYAEDNVVVTYGGDVLMADQVHFNPTTKEATAKGNVRLYMMDQIYRGDLLTYNFRTKKILSERFRFLDGKMMVEGETINSPELGHYDIGSGSYSTDNRESPGWKVKASSVSLYPGDKTIVENSVAYFGEVPFFYFPYLVQYERDGDGDVNVSPGSVTRLGIYALGSYRFVLNDKLRGEIDLDYYSRRGWAGGAQLSYVTPNKNNPLHPLTEIGLRGWYINDRGYKIYDGDTDRPTVAAPNRGRYWFPYKHNTTILKGGNKVDADRAPAFDAPSLSSRSRVNVLSDAYVTQDFFASDYILDQQPNTYLDAMYQDPNFTVTANARTQINNLFQTQQQKPSAKIEFKRQAIPGTYDPEELAKDPEANPGLFYEGESSVNYLGTQWSQVSTNNANYTGIRYDSFHQFLYPRQYFGWLNFTPRAGIRGTVYTRDNLAPGYGLLNNQQNTTQTNKVSASSLTDTALFRYVFNVGADFSYKTYATWNDIKEKAMGVDGLRHVFEPFVNFSYIPQPNIRPTRFAGYDNRVNSTESQPLNSTLYNSVDAIDQMLIVRPGIMNRLMTKRDGAPYELANWKIYGDYQPIRPNLPGLNTPLAQLPETVPSDFPELYNQVNIMPVPWWTATVGATTSVSSNGFNSLNLGSTWQIVPALQFQLGYSFLEQFSYVDALNNQVQTDNQTQIINGGANYRLNESWFFNAGVTYSMDPSLVQQVNFGIYRDIGAWILGAQVANRQNIGAPSEFVALATLTLKAFPDMPLGFNQAPTSSGVTIAGKQQGF